MEIKILGTRGEIKPTAPRHANHSGILIDGKLMFDLGEKKFLRLKPQAIFITHLHPDHAFFVRDSSPPLLSTRPAKPRRSGKERLGEVKIFAPERHKNCPSIKVIRRTQTIGAYPVRSSPAWRDATSNGAHKITPIPTIHSKNVKSQAYLIERGGNPSSHKTTKGGTKILYTGDMIWIKKKFWKFLKNLDLVITEGSFMKMGGMIQRDKKSGLLWGHQGIPDLIKFFSRFTGRIIITHFGSWFYKDMKTAEKEIKALGKKYGIEAVTGYDGMEITIH